MVENVIFSKSKRASNSEVSALLSQFLNEKRDKGIDLSSVANVRKHDPKTVRVKLSDEKEMALSLLLAGIPEEDNESIGKDSKQKDEENKTPAKPKQKSRETNFSTNSEKLLSTKKQRIIDEDDAPAEEKKEKKHKKKKEKNRIEDSSKVVEDDRSMEDPESSEKKKKKSKKRKSSIGSE